MYRYVRTVRLAAPQHCHLSSASLPGTMHSIVYTPQPPESLVIFAFQSTLAQLVIIFLTVVACVIMSLRSTYDRFSDDDDDDDDDQLQTNIINIQLNKRRKHVTWTASCFRSLSRPIGTFC